MTLNPNTLALRATADPTRPRPTIPSVSPRIRADPEAASRNPSGPQIFFPSRTMFASQYVRLYKFNIKHTVESATSSTPYPGTLHTAIPDDQKKHSVTDVILKEFCKGQNSVQNKVIIHLQLSTIIQIRNTLRSICNTINNHAKQIMVILMDRQIKEYITNGYRATQM